MTDKSLPPVTTNVTDPEAAGIIGWVILFLWLLVLCGMASGIAWVIFRVLTNIL